MSNSDQAKRIRRASAAANARIVYDGKSITVRDYLLLLLRALWIEDEKFSGKRPLGNGGWKFDVYGALIRAKAIGGTLDDDGYVEQCDTAEADAVILDVIGQLS